MSSKSYTKNRVTFLVAVALVVAASVAGVHTALATAVPIPSEINAYLAGLIFAAVTAGFSYLFLYLGLDLREFGTPIAGVLSAWILSQLQGWVNTIPDSFDPYVSIAFKIIVVVLSGIGTLYVVAKHRGVNVAEQGLL